MIWDLHCHLVGVEGRTPDERMVRLLELADRMEVERLVLFMGQTFLIDPTPDEFRRQNDEVLQALSHWHHRAFGFVYLNPRHEEESLRELDRCVKMAPWWVSSYGSRSAARFPACLRSCAARRSSKP